MEGPGHLPPETIFITLFTKPASPLTQFRAGAFFREKIRDPRAGPSSPVNASEGGLLFFTGAPGATCQSDKLAGRFLLRCGLSPAKQPRRGLALLTGESPRPSLREACPPSRLARRHIPKIRPRQQTILMDNGQIFAHGKHAELLSRRGRNTSSDSEFRLRFLSLSGPEL